MIISLTPEVEENENKIEFRCGNKNTCVEINMK